MIAIVYKDWLIVGPQESIRPYSMQCSGRVCGSDRDFFALSTEAAVSAPLLNNLSLLKNSNQEAVLEATIRGRRRSSSTSSISLELST